MPSADPPPYGLVRFYLRQFFRQTARVAAILLVLSACTPNTENPSPLVRLSGSMEAVPSEPHYWGIGAESRTVFPIKKYTMPLDESVVGEGGILSTRDIVDTLNIPAEYDHLAVQINSAYRNDFTVLTVSNDTGSANPQPASLALVPTYLTNLLGNGDFSDFDKRISPQPWEFDWPDDDGPRIAAQLGDRDRDGWELELLPRSDGKPTRVWQHIQLAQVPDKDGKLDASVRLYADAAEEAKFEVLIEYDNKIVSLGSVWHPGGSEWRSLSLTAAVPEGLPTADLIFRVESHASLPNRVIMDSGVLTLPGSFPRVRGTLEIVASSSRSQITQPLTVPEDGGLDFGIAIGQAFDGLPGGAATFVIAIEESGNRQEIFREHLARSEGAESPGTWQDRRIDLSSWSGQTVRLIFDAEMEGNATRPGQAPEQWSLPLWGDLAMTSARKRQGKRKPNIILISLDTLRADRLGCYGYDRETSPNLDRFAGESFLFEQCYAPTSWTTPSHASVFTGQLPSVHGAGVRRGINEVRSVLPNRTDTLARVAAGFDMRTAAYTEGYFAGFRWGLGQGFDRYSDGATSRSPSTRNVESTLGQAQDWLRARGDNPFLMFVHTYAAHWPYDAPEPFGSRFATDSDVAMPSGDAVIAGDLEPKQFELLSSLYDGGVAYLDQEMGRFLGFLSDEGLFENSVVIVFSDHGEEFGEHGGTMHGFTLYNEVLHVPLMIRMPGNKPVGGRIKDLVALTDIYATVLELLEAEDADVPVTSVSLMPHIEGTSTTAPRTVWGELVQHKRRQILLAAQTASEKYIATTHYGHAGCMFPDSATDFEKAYALQSNIAMIQGLSDSRFGNVSDDCIAPEEEMYILPDDRAETHDVAEENPNWLAEVRAQALAALGQIRALTRESGATELSEPLTPEEIERLRTIGYTE